MKRNYKKLLIITLVFGLIFSNVLIAHGVETEQIKNTVTVIGTATVKVSPNIVYVNIGVRTENKNAKVAQEKNAELINKIKQSLVSQYNLAETDIRTSYYSVNPSYDYKEGKQIFRGYTVEHNLEITIRDFEKTGEIVDTAVANGATSVNNIRFDIIDADATYNLALQKAIANATTKSKAITDAIGVNQGRAISVVEQSSSGGIFDQGVAKAEMQLAAVPTVITQSEIEVTARVMVVFQY